MQLFRRKGFAAVTVRDIERVTGLHATSLYMAYGNKEGVFAAALAAYNERVVAGRVRAHLEDADSATDGIRSYFHSLFATDVADDPGCLVTNTAVESFVLEGRAREGAAEGLEIIRAGLEAAVARGIEEGELAKDLHPREVSLQLLAVYQGVLVLVRFGLPLGDLGAVVDGALPRLLPLSMKS